MKTSEKGFKRMLIEMVEVIVIAFALSWLIRSFVIEARIVPTGSMLDTIQLDDRVMIDKFFFKHFHSFQTGDIIVFKPPSSAHATEDFIKRVIGLPGDKVEILNQKTYVNDRVISEAYVNDPAKSDFGPITVPADSLFVMG
ncbi:MAG: signal peptidase I, partial [Peptococcaceae bacterium]|nr:signal peptidase I [Peptococcaceae bacterium]